MPSAFFRGSMDRYGMTPSSPALTIATVSPGVISCTTNTSAVSRANATTAVGSACPRLRLAVSTRTDTEGTLVFSGPRNRGRSTISITAHSTAATIVCTHRLTTANRIIAARPAADR